jgi:hypothetical protein
VTDEKVQVVDPVLAFYYLPSDVDLVLIKKRVVSGLRQCRTAYALVLTAAMFPGITYPELIALSVVVEDAA